ncbi:MAG: hypothetical protein GX220_03310 [Treponema sp.]|nr:hypothetical protein [Treponema sp.]
MKFILKKSFLIFLTLFLFTFVFAKEEKLTFVLGTEGGTFYDGTVVSVGGGFSHKYELNFFNVNKFNSFNTYAFQATTKNIDLLLKSTCYFLSLPKFTLGFSGIYHTLFLFNVCFEHDIIGIANLVFGSKEKLFFILDLSLSHKGCVIYSLSPGKKYLPQGGFGFSMAFKKIILDDWKLLAGLKTYEMFRYPVSLNAILFFEGFWKINPKFEMSLGLYARFTDLYSMTAFFDYFSVKCGVSYVF